MLTFANPKITPDLQKMEDMWTDTHDPHVATFASKLDGFDSYWLELVLHLEKTYGTTLTVYAAMSRAQWEGLLFSDGHDPMGVFLTEDVVHQVAGPQQKMAIKMRVPAKDVLLMGCRSLDELVIDPSNVLPGDVIEVWKQPAGEGMGPKAYRIGEPPARYRPSDENAR